MHVTHVRTHARTYAPLLGAVLHTMSTTVFQRVPQQHTLIQSPADKAGADEPWLEAKRERASATFLYQGWLSGKLSSNTTIVFLFTTSRCATHTTYRALLVFVRILRRERCLVGTASNVRRKIFNAPCFCRNGALTHIDT